MVAYTAAAVAAASVASASTAQLDASATGTMLGSEASHGVDHTALPSQGNAVITYIAPPINNAINIDRDNTNAQPAGDQHQMDPDLLPQVKAQQVYELVTARAARPERTTPPWESPVPGHPRWVAGNHGAC
jgi:hypothetical protein